MLFFKTGKHEYKGLFPGTALFMSTAHDKVSFSEVQYWSYIGVIASKPGLGPKDTQVFL